MAADPKDPTDVSRSDAEQAFTAHMSSLPGSNDSPGDDRDKGWLDEYVPDDEDNVRKSPDDGGKKEREKQPGKPPGRGE